MKTFNFWTSEIVLYLYWVLVVNGIILSYAVLLQKAENPTPPEKPVICITSTTGECKKEDKNVNR